MWAHSTAVWVVVGNTDPRSYRGEAARGDTRDAHRGSDVGSAVEGAQRHAQTAGEALRVE